MNAASTTEVVGYLGSALIAAGFLAACLGHAERRPNWFLAINLVGAIALCLPAYQSGTTAALAINGFWILVALSGLAAGRRQGVPLPMSNMVLYVYGASSIGLLLADWILRRAGSITALGGLVAMALFMAGYFVLSRDLHSKRAVSIYLWTALAGNLLYIPLLVSDDNRPILALQILCTAIAVARLAHLRAHHRKQLASA
ncbi:TPA: hypothetical protein ACQQ5N_002943 [Pseudomonas aeruginosa]|nr:hypothetical protein [Pseudomonas aeruginosa]